MNPLVLSIVLVLAVVAVTRALGSAIFGSQQNLAEIFVHAIACAALLAPLLIWMSRSRQAPVTVDESDSGNNQNANIDPVTNTLNLRGLTINLLESMALAERYDRDLAVVMLSVGGIEKLQEDHGEQAIEAVLQMMGDTLVETLRIPDRSGRYQGNTFLVILPETDSSGAKQIAERVLKQIVETRVRLTDTNTFTITASAGVAPFRSGDDPQLILQRAQSALAQAQQQGQNQTVALA